MQEWVQRVFEAPEFGVLVLPAAVLLGLLTAVSSGCNLAVLAAVAGSAGSRQDARRRDVVLMCVCFALGTILAMSVIGSLVGYLGQVAGSRLGLYGQAFMGVVVILFGLAVLGLLPFRLPRFQLAEGKRPRGLLNASIFGFAVGGGSTACTVACCGPLLPVALGLAALRGEVLWGALIMMLFAVGYTLPMAVAMLGISLGRLAGFARRAAKPVRVVAGILLLGVGFWLLGTL